MKKHISTILILITFIIGGFFINKNFISASDVQIFVSPLSIKSGEPVNISWSISSNLGYEYCMVRNTEEYGGIKIIRPPFTSETITVHPYVDTLYDIACYDNNYNKMYSTSKNLVTVSSDQKCSYVNDNLNFFKNVCYPVCIYPKIYNVLSSSCVTPQECKNLNKNTLIDSKCFAACVIPLKFDITEMDCIDQGVKKGINNIFLETKKATDITQYKAILHGTGGVNTSNSNSNPKAYFRYSKADISPIFCNDIYGTNMIATKDIKLEKTYKDIENAITNTYVPENSLFWTSATGSGTWTSNSTEEKSGTWNTDIKVKDIRYYLYDEQIIWRSNTSNNTGGTLTKVSKTEKNTDPIITPLGTWTATKGTGGSGEATSKIIPNLNSFSQEIKNLKPDTTYYYCAIVSDKTGIAYGGTNAVKSFHTSPLNTTIETKDATNVTPTTATLNGSYSSVKSVKTYFEIKEDTFINNNGDVKGPQSFNFIKKFISKIINTAEAIITTDYFNWTIKGEKSHSIGKYSNLSGDISVTVSGLKPDTKYLFVAKTDDTEAISKPGYPLSFRTSVEKCKNGNTDYPDCKIKPGTGTGDDTNKPNDKPSTISVTVTADKKSLNGNESTTIRWSSKNATSCDGATDGEARITETKGSFKTASLTESKEYIVTCTGTNGTASDTVNIFVKSNTTNICSNGATNYPACDDGGNGGGDNLFPVVTVTADKSSLNGTESTTIRWSSTNVTYCDGATDGEARITETEGSFKTANLTKSKAYTVTCTGANGTASDTVNIYVNGDGTGGDGSTLPTVTLTADKSSLNSGESTIVHWESKNSTSCDTGINTETKFINLAAQAIKALIPTTSGSFNTGALTKSKAYTVTCTGANGIASDTVNIYVNGTGGGDDKLPTVSLRADKTSLNGTESTTIRWSSTNVTYCDGATDGEARITETEGSFKTANLTKSKAYTVTCIGANGTASDTVNIYVNTIGNNTCTNGATNYPKCTVGPNGSCINNATNPPDCNDGGIGDGDKLPTVTITANPSSLDSGSSSIVSWTSTNTTSCDVGDGNTVRSGTWTSTDWNSGDGGKSGTWNTAANFGTWTAPLGGGGTGNANWIKITKNSGIWNKGLYFGLWTSNKSITTSGSFDTGSLTTSKAYTVTCTGDYGTATSTVNILVGGDPNNNKLPTITVTADKSSLNSGESTIVRWESKNTTSCDTGINTKTKSINLISQAIKAILPTTSGSFNTGALTASRAFAVTCVGEKGKVAGTVNIFIGGTNACTNGATNYPACNDGGIGNDNKLPTVSLWADKSSFAVEETPATTTIHWESNYADSCDTGINAAGISNGTETKGSFNTDPLTKSRAYTVSCTGKQGTASENVYIFIDTVDTNNLLPTISVTSKPSSVKSGLSSIVEWKSDNTTSCDVASDRDGVFTETSGSFETDKLTGSRSYVAICSGPQGMVAGDTTISINTGPDICLNKATNPPMCSVDIYGGCTNGATNPPICNIDAYLCTNGATNPPKCNNIIITDNPTCLNGATNYPACTIGNGPDYPCLNGATNPPLCTANPIRCTNGATNYPTCSTITNSKSINLFPTVNMKANPLSVSSGGSSTISWTSNNTTSCNAGDGHGAGTTGSFNTGALTESKSFFVTCTGANGTSSDNIYVFVNNNSNNINTKDPNTNDKNTGDWGTQDKGKSGTWTTGTGSGTWTTTKGTGGTDGATWVSTGKDKGTWTSPTGSGTWKTTKGTVGIGNTGTWGEGKNIGILNTTPLVLGQTATPPWDAIVRYHEGIETVLMRQIMGDITFAKMYGYKEGNDLQTFAWDTADAFAKKFGYINTDRKEIRVSVPDRAAYQLQLIGDKLTIYEYFDYKIVDVRNLTTVFKSTSGYEYYFQK